MPCRSERSTPSTIAALVLLLAAGCHSGSSASVPASPTKVGPEGVVRVALADLPWPLDPVRVEGRDETTVARALLATPLRTDPETRALRPGLCRSWRPDATARTWRFECLRADAVAAALRRVMRMAASPSGWLFTPIAGLRVVGGETLVVRLRFPWRRFPFALTVPAAAPPDVPGPFRVVAASRDRIVAERPGLRLVFLRLAPHLALSAFRHDLVDEAQVPLGELAATRADPRVAASLRVRPIRAVDLVDLGAALDHDRSLRLAYWRTAVRADYQALVPEFSAPEAFGLLRTEGGEDRASPRLFRSARASIRDLPRVRVPIEVRDDPNAVYGARLLWASWRDVGLRPRVVTTKTPAVGTAAVFRRLLAAYPRPEALLAAVLLSRPHDLPARRALLDALASRDPLAALARADEELQADARVIPIAWVSDARLVSGRLRGWRHDALGGVDYVRVRALARSPSR